ncbi:pantoate--beta-alanine ligase [Psychroflexus maritimus]|uniref:Pantothenate synthetase n=1 Tax=Psychroflexus maritimus TaxID=2714865 RepID=A0A967E1X0_9FLAO|nr:pantoate--beta-alanine ligase [Psychroflexus maritimus]NGZ89209.1 pantoate--beta-alanine ligase [Psychroflexus maritimus]
MQVRTIEVLQSELHKVKNRGEIIGLVPTMGALHDGHLALVNHAFESCDCVVVSIFVNPTQFNNASDLNHYPRDVERDVELLQKNKANTIIFTPSVEEIYKESVKAEEFDFGSITQFMEGEFRQGHFNGVGTIIKHLFEIVQPHKAFFGEKDYQQLRLIKKLVQITKQPVEVIGSPTYRETSGLAKSSRNKRLNKKQLETATLIYQALTFAKDNFNQLSIAEIKHQVIQLFEQEHQLELEYFEIASTHDLVPTETKKAEVTYRAFIAAVINEVRLIDNMALN